MHCAAAITEFLYLGSYAALIKDKFLEENKIKLIINATVEIPDCHFPGITTFRVKITDSPTSKIEEYFDQVSDLIEARHKDGENVFVHCVAGVSRSASLVIAYLMKHQKLKLLNAHALVKSKRTMIRPNSGFWVQLVEYEKKLFKENTVKMIPTTLGWLPSVYESEVVNMVW